MSEATSKGRQRLIAPAAVMAAPAVLWSVSIVFDVASRQADNPDAYARASWWTILFGLPLAVGVVFASFVPGRRANGGRRGPWVHTGVQAASTVALIVAAVVRNDGRWDPVSIPLIVVSVVALAAYTASGWLEGTLRGAR